MKLEILDINNLIEVNELAQVTSSKTFGTNFDFDENGILSNEIFGRRTDDRRDTFAYIDLKKNFIHPHIYSSVLTQMFKNIGSLVGGQKRYIIKDGLLLESPDGWTGITKLYENWDKIKWENKGSMNRNNTNILVKSSINQVFTSRFLICPPAYRDVILSGEYDPSTKINELNKMYTDLLKAVSSIQEGGLFDEQQYSNQYKIQSLLVKIYKKFQSLIAKKAGIIKRSVMGKTPDFGNRTVISAFQYNNETIHDNMVDLDHSAIPISHCCSTFYPLIEAAVQNFFTRQMVAQGGNMFNLPENQGNVEIDEPDYQFSEKVIKKMIRDYVFNPDNRFKIINVRLKVAGEPQDIQMMLKGKVFVENNITKELSRPMTVTDVLYICAVEVCEHRHIMTTRYPIGTDKGMFFNKINVQSTNKHIRLLYNGKEYKNYPMIDLGIHHNMVGSQFIDTTVFSNSHLAAMGGDFDGDQVSSKGIWSDEANAEAESIMNNKMSVLNITGSNSKTVDREVCNSLYAMTKVGPDQKALSEPDTKLYLSMNPDDFTKTFLFNMFANTIDCENNNKARIPKHNPWDIMVIPKNHFYDGQSQIQSTVGRYVVNKYIFAESNTIKHIKYINDPIPKGSLEAIDSKIGDYLLTDKITKAEFNSYVDRKDNLGYWLNGILAHSISSTMMTPLPEITKLKAELVKKHEDAIKAGDIDVMNGIEKELIGKAKELLKEDPGMELYDCGDLNFDNNYRANAIIKGAVPNEITGKFDFVSTSFMDGIKPEDLHVHANSILAAQFPSSNATKESGYLAKQLMALLQMVELDEPGSDCGTKNLIEFDLTEFNKKFMTYTYIRDEGKLILLTPENISSYVGKRLKMRSPMSCISKKLCSKCAGELFRYLGIERPGLYACQLSHTALNLALKAKHDSSIKLYKIDPNNIIQSL